MSRRKEILGLWIKQSEDAEFWLRVMSEPKNRAIQDIVLAVVDELRRLPPDVLNGRDAVSKCRLQTLQGEYSFDYRGPLLSSSVWTGAG